MKTDENSDFMKARQCVMSTPWTRHDRAKRNRAKTEGLRCSVREVKRTFLLTILVAGCSSSPSAPPQVPDGCNPLIGDDCMTPFPSSLVETADASTATGLRVAIADSTLPSPHAGNPLTAARLNLHDGVSPSTPFVVYFKEGVDPTQLPTLATLDQSVTATSTVQVIDFATGERVPVMAELDSHAMPGARQALLIRPMVRLAPATRYVIALVGLNDANGKALAPAGFVALRDKKTLNKQLEPLVATYEDIFSKLESAGVTRKSLTLAWDVTTASDNDVIGHLVQMRDEALAMTSSLAYTITSSTDTTNDPFRFRQILGTFQVPWYLTDTTSMTATLHADAQGKPVMNGMGTANFVIDIPACAQTANGPLPVMVFGHGLFGTAPDELATPYMKQVGNYLCMVQIGTDWLGLSTPDFPVIADNVLPDFNRINIVTDRLQQAHVNAQVLTRLFLTVMKNDAALKLNGKQVTDGSQIYYYGISDGGIQGGTYMGLSQDVTRGVLNVPGCEWSLLIQRSTDFANLQQILDVEYADPLDQQLLLALLQPEWDFTDPAGFAPHLLASPLPNTPVKQILVQEAIHDAQVTNVATRVLARTMGLPGVDLETPVYGIPEMAAPQASAYTQWDVMPTPVPPDANAAAPSDNGAHGEIRKLVDLETQLQGFLAPAGQVTQTCTGPCVCNFPAGTCMNAPGTN